MFIRLGFQNAWRNLSRSILAIVSMAFAAAFLTYVISLGKGYANQAGQPLRSMLGGEIVVYSEKITAETPTECSSWSYRQGELDPFTDMEYLFPNMKSTGYLREDNQPGFTKEELKQLSSFDEINGIHPLYRLPAETVKVVDPEQSSPPLPEHLLRIQDDGSVLGPEISYSSGLQGRDWRTNQEYSLGHYITNGRWFEEKDEEDFVGVVSSLQQLPQWVHVPLPGEKITLEIPSFRWIQGAWQPDYSETHRFEIEIIGNVTVQSRTVDYIAGIDGWVTEPVYAYFNEIYIPQGAWNQIWSVVAGGLVYVPSEVLLQVDDLTFLQDIVFDLQSQFPQFSIIDIPHQLERVHANLSLEPVVPMGARSALQDRKEQLNQGVLASDLRLPIALLVLINAALLVAANILILVAERKKEIAVLKAIGARESEIIRMVLAEAILVSGVGALLGFSLIRVQAFLNQWTNALGLLPLIWLLFLDLVMILGMTLFAAILFGWIPAKKYASLSVMEVLRNE